MARFHCPPAGFDAEASLLEGRETVPVELSVLQGRAVLDRKVTWVELGVSRSCQGREVKAQLKKHTKREVNALDLCMIWTK